MILALALLTAVSVTAEPATCWWHLFQQPASGGQRPQAALASLADSTLVACALSGRLGRHTFPVRGKGVRCFRPGRIVTPCWQSPILGEGG